MLQKRRPYYNQKIRDAAEGELCTAELPGCHSDGSDTAFRHLNEHWAGKGYGQKADDIAGFFGCQHCENLYSGLIIHPAYDRERDAWMIHRANIRTLRRCIDKGVLK